MNAELMSDSPVRYVSAQKEQRMNSPRLSKMRALAAAVALALPAAGWAFTSGSSGADGALAPTVNTEVVLPPSGVLNYTTINIPSGVTVTFRKNVTNTPVVLLVSGDATIAGTINVSGATSVAVGAAGNGSVGDDGQPGTGGPGGYAGGRGGALGTAVPATNGGAGNGPGGGMWGIGIFSNCWGRQIVVGGAGGGYSGAGADTGSAGSSCYNNHPGAGGGSYGSSSLLPLIGGSGGGGAGGGIAFPGSGGGGGGGAFLLAASGTVNVTGSILSNGGASGAAAGDGAGSSGGGGSGGAIRIVATTLSGNGAISAVGGGAGSVSAVAYTWVTGSSGASGRIRLEAETYTRTAASTPAHSFAAPGPIFIAGLPTLAITNVGGAAVPASPTGVADVSLPATTVNPVTVAFQTTGVPVGNTITVKVTPAYGATSSSISTALTGTTANATASASITLPTGPSTLQATVTYTIVASLGDLLSRFAQNERVEKITVSAVPGSASKATLITVSGKQYDAPAEALQIAALGG
ncbi:MAG: hypothetical protein K2X97_12425 [Mycobacteriaceae bacterium]|nr:hypothetical protein [Mycobacteriaceae bacterium]